LICELQITRKLDSELALKKKYVSVRIIDKEIEGSSIPNAQQKRGAKNKECNVLRRIGPRFAFARKESSQDCT
jgi:hypothetical protein